MLDQL